jgi:hypothetical protein
MEVDMGQDDEPIGSSKHGQARQLAEAALRARRAGDDAKADELFAEAERTDPEAVINVLQEHEFDRGAVSPDDLAPQDDAEIARMTSEVKPHSDAPSRANISGAGSGADAE